MKYLITENQHSRIKEQILDLFDSVGIIRTLNRYKLDPKALDFIFKNDFPDFTCSDLDDLFTYFFRNGYIKRRLDYEYKDNIYDVEITMDYHTAAIGYAVEDLRILDGILVYATPFWEGQCYVPLETTSYYLIPGNQNNDDGEEGRLWYDIQVFSSYDNIDPSMFRSFTDILDWYYTTCIDKTMEFAIEALFKARIEYENNEL